MKKIIAILSACTMLFVFASCSNSTASTNSGTNSVDAPASGSATSIVSSSAVTSVVEPMQTVNYNNISFQCPDNLLPADNGTILTIPLDSGGISTIAFTFIGNVAASVNKDFASSTFLATQKTYESMFSAVSFGEVTETTVCGNVAYSVNGEMSPADSDNFKTEFILFTAGENAYLATFLTTTGNYAAYKPTLDAIMQSITVI